MQAVSLDYKPTKADLEQLLRTMREKDILTDPQIKAINIKQILDFFESPLGKQCCRKRFSKT